MRLHLVLAISLGAVLGYQADKVTNGAFASTLSTGAAKTFGFGIKAAGGAVSTTFGLVAETAHTGIRVLLMRLVRGLSLAAGLR